MPQTGSDGDKTRRSKQSRQSAHCKELVRLHEDVERLQRDTGAASSQLGEFARASSALFSQLEEANIDEWTEIVSSHMLLSTVRILNASGGVMYLRQDEPLRKRMVAAVEDDRIIDASTDARFRPLTRSQVIGGPARIVWSRLSDPDGYWLTSFDDPLIPPKIVQWHRNLGHKWLAHFALRHKSSLRGFFVIAYGDGQEMKPVSVHLGIILALEITNALDRVRLAQRARDLAMSDEHTRFCQELDEPFAQGFAGIALQLAAASRELGASSPPFAQTHIDTALQLARDNLALARRFGRGFSAGEQHPQGLADNLRSYVKAIQRTGSAKILMKLNPITLRRSCEDPLLRIAHEAISNAVKHASAKTIRVNLFKMPMGGIRLSFEDDGVGFKLNQRQGGTGIERICQTAAILGAELTIITEPGLGTELIVVLPSQRSGN